VSLTFWSHVQRCKNLHCTFEVTTLDGKPKLNKGFIKSIIYSANSLIDDNLSPSFGSLYVFYISFDVIDSDLVWVLDVVPDVQVLSTLCHHYIRVWYPLDIATELK